jgi:S-adenosylmethionine decarboxylase
MELFGFNNLTKSLCFNIYGFCYAGTEAGKKGYVARMDERYDAQCLTRILADVAAMINATVLSVSKQDYEPHGASATLLIAEEPMCVGKGAVVAHLDKSHIAVHTYPEHHPASPVATFRVDIDVATCGELTPLRTLDYLIGCFDADIVTIDYKVRGFTRAAGGEKIYMDHAIGSIRDYIDKAVLKNYTAVDGNLRRANTFHTKLLRKEIDPRSHMFFPDTREQPPENGLRAAESLSREMEEVFRGAGPAAVGL